MKLTVEDMFGRDKGSAAPLPARLRAGTARHSNRAAARRSTNSVRASEKDLCRTKQPRLTSLASLRRPLAFVLFAVGLGVPVAPGGDRELALVGVGAAARAEVAAGEVHKRLMRLLHDRRVVVV